MLLKVLLFIDDDLAMSHVHSVHFFLGFVSLSPEWSQLMKSLLAVPFVPSLWELIKVHLDLVLMIVHVKVSIDHNAYIPFAVGVLGIEYLSLFDVSNVLESSSFSLQEQLLFVLDRHFVDLIDVLVNCEFVGSSVDQI